MLATAAFLSGMTWQEAGKGSRTLKTIEQF